MSTKIRITRGPRAGIIGDSELVAFAAALPPALEPGSYTVTATHTVQSPDGTTVNDHFQETVSLAVYGSRYTLARTAIVAQYPAPGATGTLSGLIATIILDIPTLPWTYAAGQTAEPPGASRLGVLVIADSDSGAPQPKTMSWADVLATASPTYFPYNTAEAGEDTNASVQVIDLPSSLFGQVAPLAADLPYLAQVRLVQLDADTRQYQAVVTGTRVVYGTGSYTAYLVSLDGYAPALPTSDGILPNQDTYTAYRMVVLTQWTFVNSKVPYSFENLVGTLNKTFTANPVLEWLPPDAANLQSSPIPYETVANLLALGYVPLPHLLRQGSTTVSFYRGPLVPIPLALDPAIKTFYSLPGQTIATPDQVLAFDPDTGTFDARLAAAWQLGQELAAGNGRLLGAMQAFAIADAQNQAIAAERAAITGTLGVEPAGPQVGELLKSVSRHLLDRTAQALAAPSLTANRETVP